MSNAIGLPSRQAALRVLLDQERSGAFLKELFPSALAGLSGQDQALARALALGVLRHRSLLDYHIDRLAPKGVSHPGLRSVLRLGALQILVMNGIPVHAAVDTSVEIARLKFGKPLSGFANALLKNLSRQGLQLPPGQDAKALAIASSHPEWLVRRWSAALGPEAAALALIRGNQEAPTWLRVNPLKGTVAEAKAALAEAGLAAEEDALAPLFLRVTGGADVVLSHRLFAEGGLSFQDPAAYFVARLLQWQPSLTALDLCSAPGGKAALLLEMAAAEGHDLNGAGVICADQSWRRMRSIRDARDRLGHRRGGGELWPLVQDALKPALKPTFDRVLADVPCSNLGVIGRRPEARWRVQEKDLSDQGGRQLAILRHASTQVAPGGRLVYATCSPEPEETSQVIAAFLRESADFSLDDASAVLPKELLRQGCLHLYPGETDYDGFFAAALQRKK